jgi:hypothetical protein
MAGDGGQSTLSGTRSNIVNGLIVATAVACILVLAVYAIVAYGRAAERRGSARFAHVFASVLAGLQPISGRGRILPLIAPSVLIWVCNGLSMCAVLVAVGIHPSAPTVALLLGVAGIAAALPAGAGQPRHLAIRLHRLAGRSGSCATPAFAPRRWSRCSSRQRDDRRSASVRRHDASLARGRERSCLAVTAP